LRFGLGLGSVAWAGVDWCEVVERVSATFAGRHDVVDLVGERSAADVADALVADEDVAGSALLAAATAHAAVTSGVTVPSAGWLDGRMVGAGL
jgi:hypothetical protein